MPVFPTFTEGESVHLPFTRIVEFQNAKVDMPHGWRHAYNLNASPFRRWEIEFLLSDTDKTTLEDFFDTCGGKYEDFDFTDPVTDDTHTNCRFDQDSLDFNCLGPNENAVRVRISHY